MDRLSGNRDAPRGPVARRTILLLFVLAGLADTGCVQRRLTIRSNPPGALVYVDNEQIGITPVAVDFIYYGGRQIRLVKDGYETLTVVQEIPQPWYQHFPLDFVTENLLPGEIRDERTVDYRLVPSVIVPTEQLLGRADELRRGSRQPGFIPGSQGQPAMIAPPRVGPPPQRSPLDGAL